MRCVFISQVHPVAPHVSGMRCWFFARELAARGHRIVQICEWREGTEQAPDPGVLHQHLKDHDWSSPLLLAIKPTTSTSLDWIRSSATPVPMRKALVLWHYWRHSGMFTDFSQAVQPYLPVLSQEFHPEVVWGVFGNTDCWLIAQRLARLSGCPWVADMKDSWEVFLRRPLRAVLARRFQDMVATTANAEFNARVLARWFPQKPSVVYSGVDRCFMDVRPAPLPEGTFRLTLTGSVYDLNVLKRFVEGLDKWLTAIGESKEWQLFQNGRPVKVEIIYAGAANAVVEPMLARLADRANIQIHSYLPLTELAGLCRSARVNTYIGSPKTFHHKLLELLSCGKPVLAFPRETEESRRLAAECAGDLRICHTQEEVMSTLDTLLRGLCERSDVHPQIDQFTWSAQANHLERVFKQALPSDWP